MVAKNVPTQETLIAKRIATLSTSLYCTKGYYSKHRPTNKNLRDQLLVLYDDQFGDIPEVLWARKHGLSGRAGLQSSSTLAMLEAVKQGCGVGLLPDFLARKNNLHLIEFPAPPARPLWLALHRDLRTEPRVKVVRQWITNAIRMEIAD